MTTRREYFFKKFKYNLAIALKTSTTGYIEDICVVVYISMDSRVCSTYGAAYEINKVRLHQGTAYILHGEQIYYSLEDENHFEDFAVNKFNFALEHMEGLIIGTIKKLAEAYCKARQERDDDIDYEDGIDFMELAEIPLDIN